MATLTTATAPVANLDDLLAHPLCSVIALGEQADDAHRFHFIDAADPACEDWATDRGVLISGQAFIAAGRPFLLTIQEPFDQAAADAEDAEDARELALLWAYHGPGC